MGFSLQIRDALANGPYRTTEIPHGIHRQTHPRCDHRAVLETDCLKFAIGRNPEDLVTKLRQGFDQMQQAIKHGDSAAHSKGDMRFHRAIIESRENGSILKIFLTTIGPLMALRTHFFTEMNAHLDKTMAEQAALLEACENRDVS